MNTVEPFTRESTVSFCNFTLSGIYKTLEVRFWKWVQERTADFAIFVTMLFGSSRFSMPSETRSC